MINHKTLSFIFLLLIVKIEKGNTVMCFTCSSATEKRCENVTNTNRAEMQECPVGFLWCYVYIHNIYAIEAYPVIIERGCSVDNICDSSDDDAEPTRFCLKCDHNLCNSAKLNQIESSDSSRTRPYLTLITFGIILLYCVIY